MPVTSTSVHRAGCRSRGGWAVADGFGRMGACVRTRYVRGPLIKSVSGGSREVRRCLAAAGDEKVGGSMGASISVIRSCPDEKLTLERDWRWTINKSGAGLISL